MNNSYFADSSVDQFFVEKNRAVLVVSDVGLKGELVKVKFTVEGYTSLKEKKGEEKNEFEVIEALSMQAPDGEALKVSCVEIGFDALIQWNFFGPPKSFTRSYEIRGKKVSVETATPYPDDR